MRMKIAETPFPTRFTETYYPRTGVRNSTLRCLINGGTLINFSIPPQELIRTNTPPSVNFQRMMKYKIFSVAK